MQRVPSGDLRQRRAGDPSRVCHTSALPQGRIALTHPRPRRTRRPRTPGAGPLQGRTGRSSLVVEHAARPESDRGPALTCRLDLAKHQPIDPEDAPMMTPDRAWRMGHVALVMLVAPATAGAETCLSPFVKRLDRP